MDQIDYEVEIFGIGPKPLRAVFTARSAGLARLAAQDKYGRWIRTGTITELRRRKPALARSRTSPSVAKNRQRRSLKIAAERAAQPVTWSEPPPQKRHGMVVPDGCWK